MKKAAIAFVLATASLLAMAQSTPAGLWKTIDDDGKTEKSLVRITNTGGVYTGKVEKVFDPAKQDAKCEKCEGARANQPVIGMTIIEGVKQDEEESNVFNGGQILDPNNGKTYKVRLTPLDGGKKLEVRGFIGPFYRNQIWVRAE